MSRGRSVPSGACAIGSCGREAQCAAADLFVCLMHYKRHARNGHFDETRRYHPKSGVRRACAVEECTVLEDGNCGMCKLHDTRRRRHGDPRVFIHQRDRNIPRGADNYQWTGTDATYTAMHQRVRKARGRAAGYRCTDGCGRMARHWSYDRLDADERESEMGPYSVDVDHYVPRCVRCHKAFDLKAIRDGRIPAQSTQGD